MTTMSHLPADFLQVDEVGLVYGCHGGYVFRSASEPVYGVELSRAHLVGVEARVSCFREGNAIPLDAFLETVGEPEMPRVEGMILALHLCNHAGHQPDGLMLFLPVPASLGAAQRWLPRLAEMLDELGELAIDPARVLVRFDDPLSARSPSLEPALAALRDRGVRIAISGISDPWLTRGDAVAGNPEIVALDAEWFHKIVEARGALRLLGQFVERLQAEGRGVLVEGVDRPEQFRAACKCGARYLMGGLFGGPRLVGVPFATRFGTGGKPPDADAKVVSLFDKSTGTHQRR